MMSVASFICLLFFVRSLQADITYIEVKYPLRGHPAPPGSPWPLPQQWKRSPAQLMLNPRRFFISTNAKQCDIIQKATERYQHIIRRTAGKKITTFASLPVLSSLQVDVISFQGADCGYPYHGSDESYVIDLRRGRNMLSANTTWGALRGLETFSQLIYTNGSSRTCLINETYIRDYPRYTHRSILLDTSRHFLSLNTIKQTLDAMSYNKFNVFHWHIVDDQSWPLQLKSFPNISQIGAYNQHYIYNQDDVREIIEYARLRGIRVIPEIDTPGHTQAIGKALPSILSACYGNGTRGVAVDKRHAAFEILDPTKDYTYDVMKSIFSEVKGLFKDEYIHLGMDEVYYDCWNSSEEVAAFMRNMGFSNIAQVEQYYVQRTLQNVKGLNYKYIIWQDPIDNNVTADESTVVTVWKDEISSKTMRKWEEYMRRVTSKGYKTVLSACWYLNIISYGADWKKLYLCDPRKFDGTEAMRDLVIGGEACMWGEYVDDTNLIPRLWPRASAVAERLWSDASVNVVRDAKYRLDQQRCRMLQRGIAAQPILNGFCDKYEHGIWRPTMEGVSLLTSGDVSLLSAAIIMVSIAMVAWCLVRLMRHRWNRVIWAGAATLKRKAIPGTRGYTHIL